MANLNISKELTPADKTTIVGKASEILIILNFLVNLTPDARKRLRTMATKRAGYVLDVFTAVLANPTAIPSTFSVEEYTKDNVLLEDLKFLLGIYLPIVEGLQDTIMTLGNELMKQSDTCYNYLQRAAKDNAPLTETVERIATAYKRTAATAAVVYTIAPGGTVEVGNVKPGRRLVNLGVTVIRLKGGNDLPPTVKLEPMVVEPGNSVVIPSGYYSIIVENVSTTEEGRFSVRLK